MKKIDLKDPPSIPRIRMLSDFFSFVKNPIPVFNKYQEMVGDTYCFNLGFGKKPIVTTNPQLVQYILQKNHRNYQKLPRITDELAHFIGRGLLVSEGKDWLKQRRLIQPAFHREKLDGLTRIMLKEINLYIKNLNPDNSGEVCLEMIHEMTTLTFSIIAKSLFSNDLSEDLLLKLRAHFELLHPYIVKKVRQPYLKLWFQLIGKQKEAELLGKEIRNIVLEIIQRRRQSLQKQDDLLDLLLAAKEEKNGRGMTDQQVLEESLILLIAGHETCANGLAWAWYLLGKHPEIVDTIRAEIHSSVDQQALDFSALTRLTYLKMVIQEVMRLYPPVWGTYRVPIENDQFGNLALTKGQTIGIFIYGLHHSATHYPNPEEFDPSRFSEVAHKQRPSFTYRPFGGGPRLCIGNNFALLEMQLILFRILQSFEIELLNDKAMEVDPLITLRPKSKILVKLKRRTKDALINY